MIGFGQQGQPVIRPHEQTAPQVGIAQFLRFRDRPGSPGGIFHKDAKVFVVLDKHDIRPD